MSKKKPLIVFEGIEGSGKTTLINYVSNYLKKKNKIDSTKEIYKVLENELKNYIHSIQISIF